MNGALVSLNNAFADKWGDAKRIISRHDGILLGKLFEDFFKEHRRVVVLLQLTELLVLQPVRRVSDLYYKLLILLIVANKDAQLARQDMLERVFDYVDQDLLQANHIS